MGRAERERGRGWVAISPSRGSNARRRTLGSRPGGCILNFRLLRTDRLLTLIECPPWSRQKAGDSHGNPISTVRLEDFRPGDGSCAGAVRPLQGRPDSSPLDGGPPGVRRQHDDHSLRSGRLGTGRWPTAQPAGVEIEVPRRPARCAVKSGPRKWNCGHCGRSNETALALDGTVTCEYCTEVRAIEPLRPWKDRLLGHVGNIGSWMTREPGGAEHRPPSRGR